MGTGEVGCHGQNKTVGCRRVSDFPLHPFTLLLTYSLFLPSLSLSDSLSLSVTFPLPCLSLSLPLFFYLSFPLSLLSSSFSSLSFTLSSLSSLSPLSISLAQMSFKQTFLQKGPSLGML